ncbi:hypothetical protein AWC38_SpisGene14200 [Stylophora pistillata]|uniref:Uncharacterized protein n=1 Tax=Stylophora pistillata TaxID=50429 RepID=A0A2B4RSA9_STYPI|nr:hypothetical protein AWC38_SpisGene14200 [Stylophora pistillata]
MLDVTMGSYDDAETCELIGTYMLSIITANFKDQVGLYRDDGLAICKATPREMEKIKQQVSNVFKSNGLKITIEANKKTVHFLDVTFDLTSGIYKPFMKPNNNFLYVHRQSNHPPALLKYIPEDINKRLWSISSSKEGFDEAIPPYQKALDDALDRTFWRAIVKQSVESIEEKLQLEYQRAQERRHSTATSGNVKLTERSIERFSISSSLFAKCDECGMEEFMATGEHDGDQETRRTIQACKDKPHYLDAVFEGPLLKIYERLSEPALLQRCLPGYTNNASESNNSLVWNKCPKHRWPGSKRIGMAANAAALYFSCGATKTHDVMREAGLVVGQHTNRASQSRDSGRVKQAVTRVQEKD